MYFLTFNFLSAPLAISSRDNFTRIRKFEPLFTLLQLLRLLPKPPPKPPNMSPK